MYLPTIILFENQLFIYHMKDPSKQIFKTSSLFLWEITNKFVSLFKFIAIKNTH
jgi:hypothetical protein